MNVRAQPNIDAACQIAGEVMQVHAAPCQRHWAVGYIGLRCDNALEIMPIRVVGLRVATDHDAVAKRSLWTEEAGLIEEFYGWSAILAQGLVKLHEVLPRVDLYRYMEGIGGLTGRLQQLA